MLDGGARLPGPRSTTAIEPVGFHGPPIVWLLRWFRQLRPDRRELLLDLVQLTLDIAGLYDPTPTADWANALASLFREDVVGFFVRALAGLPVLGDIAKLGRWVRKKNPSTMFPNRMTRQEVLDDWEHVVRPSHGGATSWKTAPLATDLRGRLQASGRGASGSR